MSNAVVVLLALGVACGAHELRVAEEPTSTMDPSEPAGTEGDVSVSDANDANDANGAAWEAFRASCAVRDCDRDVMLACPDREGPPPTAACVDARCVLH